jgi:hypothetical protein
MRNELRQYICLLATTDLYQKYKLRKLILLYSQAIVFILYVGFNSFAYAGTKYKYFELDYYPGTDYATYVPASQYTFANKNEAYSAFCAKLEAASYGLYLDCPVGTTNWARFYAAPYQSGTNYESVMIITDFVNCDDQYVRPDGTCSAIPYQQPMPIAQSVKNFGSGADCPSPYVSY